MQNEYCTVMYEQDDIIHGVSFLNNKDRSNGRIVNSISWTENRKLKNLFPDNICETLHKIARSYHN